MIIERGEEILSSLKGGEGGCQISLLAQQSVAVVECSIDFASRHERVIENLYLAAESDNLLIALLHTHHICQLTLILCSLLGILEIRYGNQRRMNITIGASYIAELIPINDGVTTGIDIF